MTAPVSTAGPASSPRLPLLRRRPRRSEPWPPGRELVIFLTSAVLVLVAVSAGTIWISQRIARANALTEAEQIAVRLAGGLVKPVLSRALAGVPGEWEQLD